MIKVFCAFTVNECFRKIYIKQIKNIFNFNDLMF